MSVKVVVIGAVAAGPKAACRLKRLKPEYDITLIDMDDLISYGGCGIPYFISGEVADEKALRSTTYHMLRDEKYFTDAKGLNVLTKTEVTSIDRQNKKIKTKNLLTGQENELPYDYLVIATGSRPNKPNIPGINLENVYTISNLHTAIEIKEKIAKGKVQDAVIIGGGPIGIEMAEAFTDMWGINTTLIEIQPQLLPKIFPKTLSLILLKHLKDKGVNVLLSTSVKEIKGENGRVNAVVTDNGEIKADLVLVSTGVKARSELAKNAGLLVSEYGGIIVNDHLQTSDPFIYACGDCIEVRNLITGRRGLAPMGSLANREGRVVADNIAGIPSKFEGWNGTYILKAFELCVGGTGITLETALSEGYDAVEALACSYDRTHFYPGSALMFITLVADRKTRRVLGMHGISNANDALLARINAISASIHKNLTVDDVGNMELAYSPPFSTAIDILNFAGYICDNLLSERLRVVDLQEFLDWMEGKLTRENWCVLDVRHEKESAKYVQRYGERWIAIPYNRVRYELDKIPSDKMLIILCNSATRAYEVQRMLDAVGKTNSLVLMGSMNLLKRIDVSWLL